MKIKNLKLDWMTSSSSEMNKVRILALIMRCANEEPLQYAALHGIQYMLQDI